MLTMLGGIAALFLLLMILGLVGIGIIIGYAFKIIMVFVVVAACVITIAKLIHFI